MRRAFAIGEADAGLIQWHICQGSAKWRASYGTKGLRKHLRGTHSRFGERLAFQYV
jgi:hypothetical protein